jgi:hypothetical protein
MENNSEKQLFSKNYLLISILLLIAINIFYWLYRDYIAKPIVLDHAIYLKNEYFQLNPFDNLNLEFAHSTNGRYKYYSAIMMEEFRYEENISPQLLFDKYNPQLLANGWTPISDYSAEYLQKQPIIYCKNDMFSKIEYLGRKGLFDLSYRIELYWGLN